MSERCAQRGVIWPAALDGIVKVTYRRSRSPVVPVGPHNEEGVAPILVGNPPELVKVPASIEVTASK